jgi:hypothetical protein
MVDFTRVNDSVFSDKSCSWAFDLVPSRGVIGVDYEEMMEGADVVHDAAKDGVPVGSVYGKYKVTGPTVTMLQEDGLRMLKQMTLKGLSSYGAARFSFTAKYSEFLSPQNTTLLLFDTCRIVGVKEGIQEGSGKLTTEFKLLSLFVTRNGMRMWDNKRSLPL